MTNGNTLTKSSCFVRDVTGEGDTADRISERPLEPVGCAEMSDEAERQCDGMVGATSALVR